MTYFQSRYERERRFLVSDISIVNSCSWLLITQAYVWKADGHAVRVRLLQREDEAGELVDLDATFALKGPRIGDERLETEGPIRDIDEVKEIIRLCETVVRKRRYQVVDEQGWDVDVFLDDNDGLVIAELEGTDIRDVRRPDWISREITREHRYNNEELAFSPYSRWSRSQRSSEADDLWDFPASTE